MTGKSYYTGMRSAWDQLRLFEDAHVILRAQYVIDGTSGKVTASVSSEDFWTGEPLTCDVLTELRFPQDMDYAVKWADNLIATLSAKCVPF